MKKIKTIITNTSTNESELENNISSDDVSIRLKMGMHKERRSRKGDKLCIMEVIKQTSEVFPDNTSIAIGEYDYTNIFLKTTEFQNEKLYGQFISLPKTCFKIIEDGKIICDTLEDGYMNAIMPFDKKYKNWKEGKERLFRAVYTFRIKLGDRPGVPSVKEIRDALDIH